MINLLRHTLTIERPTDGAVDAYNQPSVTYATFASVPGLVQPKSVREMAQLNQSGATVSAYTAYLRPVWLRPSDRITVATGDMAGTYEVDGIRNAAGIGHHLEVDCHLVVA